MSGRVLSQKKVHKSNIYTLLVVLLVMILIVLTIGFSNLIGSKNNFNNETAQFDLSNIDFEDNNYAYLRGNWEYYSNVLLATDSVKNATPTALVKIPSARSSVSGSILDNSAYASYRCILTNVHASDYLMIYVPNISSAYSIYINGVLVTRSGEITDGIDEIWTTSTYNEVPFRLESNGTYEVVVEIASKNNSGLYMPVKLANYTVENQRDTTTIATRFILCGLVFSCAIIFIFFKYVINKSLYSLWLPVLSFVLLIRMLLTGESFAVIQQLLFNVSFEEMEVFTFISTFIIKLIALMYITKSVKIDTADNVFVGFSAAFLLLAISVNYLPNTIFDSYYYLILQLISAIIDIYIINKLCIEIAKKTSYSLLYLISYLFIILGLTVDSFYTNGLVGVNLSQFMPICFMLFVLFTVLIQALRIRKIFDIALESQKLQTELERANTSIMLSQIQPHFMYNALNTIKSLIKRDPPKAEKAVIDFSRYLRGNMDSLTKLDPIPFSEELEHVKYYCNIEQLRFQDKLDIFYEIGPDQFFVPTLSVQPIVENAIKHGVTKRAEGGSVTISTEEDENNYYITVEDDGVGFDVNHPEKYRQDNRSHVGLQNIKDRFTEIMGAEVKVESTLGVGSKITVVLPKEKNVDTLQESLEINNKTINTLEEMDI